MITASLEVLSQTDIYNSWMLVTILNSYERNVICSAVLKSNEDMILALAGQLKQLSHEPEKFR